MGDNRKFVGEIHDGNNYSPAALSHRNLSASISPSSPLQMERIDDDLSCDLSSFQKQTLSASTLSAYKNPAAPVPFTPGLSHPFYEYSLLESKILVPQAYILKHDKFAIREGRASVSDNEYQLSKTTISAFIYTIFTMKSFLDRLSAEKNKAIRDLHVREGELRHYRLRAEDTAKLLDENTRMKKSSVEFFQDLERLTQRTKTLEEEILIHRRDNQILLEENRQIDILKQLLKEEKDITATLSRKLQDTENSLEEKSIEILRLEQALQTAIVEYERQRDNATSAPVAGVTATFSTSVPSTPLPKDHRAPMTPQTTTRTTRKNLTIRDESFFREEPQNFENTVLINTQNDLHNTQLYHVSTFPPGISFQKQYSEFVLIARNELTKVITAFGIYPEFYSEFFSLGQYLASIFSAADQYVKEFSGNALVPVLNRVGLKSWPYHSSTNKHSTGNISSFTGVVSSSYPDIFQYICCEMQHQSFLALEQALAQLHISFFPSDIQRFHQLLVRLSNLDEHQASMSASSPILDASSMQNFVLLLFRQFAKFLWIAQFSHPPCLLFPVCGTVLADARILCEEIMSCRRNNVISVSKDEIVLIPALYYYADHDRDMHKAELVAQGLSYSLQCMKSQIYPSYIDTTAYWSTKPFSVQQLLTLPRVGNMTYLNSILQLLIHCPSIWRFLNSSITTRTLLPEILNKYQSTNNESLLYVLYSLGRKMLESTLANDLIYNVQSMESIVAKMHPILYANKHPSDAATLLLLIFLELQKEFKDIKTQVSSQAALLYPGIFKRSMCVMPWTTLHQQAQDVWRAILLQEGNGENPIVEMSYPLRRCSRTCVHCHTTSVTFDVQPIITLPIPTLEQRTLLRALSSTNTNAISTLKDLYRVTVIVQLLDGVPAMVSMPLMVSKSSSIADVKRMIVEHLVVLKRLSLKSRRYQNEDASSFNIVDIDDEMLSNVHFHICTLKEFDPATHEKRAWKVLRLSAGYNATGNEEKDENTMQTITIGDIFSDDQLEKSGNHHSLHSSCVLVACQLSEPAPVNNDVQSREEQSDFIYYDVSFASFRLESYPNKWKIDPIELSIPFRLSYDIGMGYPSQHTLQRHIEHLATRIFPSKKTQHLFDGYQNSTFNINIVNQSTPPPPTSYEVEMFFLNKNLTEYNSAKSPSSSSSLSRHPQRKCERIVAGIYHATQNVNKTHNLTAQYTVDRAACCTVYEPISRHYQGKTSLSTVNYKAVSLRNLLHPLTSRSTTDRDKTKGFTLLEAFQSLSLQKTLSSVQCASCNAGNLQVAYDYWQFGEMIMIHLSQSTNGEGEGEVCCWYPIETLDIRDVIACGDKINASNPSADPTVPEDAQQYLYDLYGVVERHAQHNPEQFVAYCRMNEQDSHRWVCFNDIVAMEVNIEEFRSDRVYLLCYVRRQ